jgi:CheY-like chemotaxis protein
MILSLETAEHRQDARAEDREPPMVRTATILCIDDDPASLVCRTFLLKANGYEVITAGSGLEGLSLFKSCAVDLVVLDYAMPEMDGGAVASQLKRLAPNTPVIMVSGQDRVPPEAIRFVDVLLHKGEHPTKFQKAVSALLASISGRLTPSYSRPQTD